MADRQQESLDALVTPEGGGTLPAMVGAVLHRAGIEASGWESSLRWDLLDLEVAWQNILSCTVSHGAIELGRLDIPLPWLLDDTARASAPVDARVGRHDGLWVGRPLVPITQLRDAPGLHVRWRARTASLDPDDNGGSLRGTVVVTPDAGGGLFFNDSDAASNEVRAVWGRTLAALRAADPGAAYVVTAGGLFAAATAARVRAALPEVFEPAFPVEDPAALTARIRALLATDRQVRDSADDEAWRDSIKFAPATSGLRAFGDLLGEGVATGVLRFLRQAQRLESAGKAPAAGQAWLGAWLSRRIAQRVTNLLTGGQPIALGDESENSLALVEVRRQVTMFGPFGLRPPVRGSLDFRDLHPGWRHTLCPIQTPESENMSLVRYLALADVIEEGSDLAQWRDLSWSAALIPFINHNEQARAILAAKNLKQAVPLVRPQVPRVLTGVEQLLAERHGVTRSPTSGMVVGAGAASIKVRGRATTTTLALGPARGDEASRGGDWLACVAPGEPVTRRAIVAHAPDVRLDDEDVPYLALGVDLMVAVTPWHGLNFEDAIVLSESAARRLRHRQRTRVSEDLWPGEWVLQVATTGIPVLSGDVLAEVRDASGAVLRRLRAPTAGMLLSLTDEPARRSVTAVVEHELALEVGDKVTNRHGGKGVVSCLLPDDDLPRLPDGTCVDLITSPAGIVRRLNVGQALEMAVGLRAHLEGKEHVVVGRRLENRHALAAALAALGAVGGRLPLQTSGGVPLFDGNPILVGPQHYLKLHHFAERKLSVRGGGEVSPTTGQPTRGTRFRDGERISSGQRLGEMELWALQAMGADAMLADALWERGGKAPAESVRPALISVVSHLAATGLLVAPGDEDGPFEPEPTHPDADLLLAADAFHISPSGWEFLSPMTPADFPKDDEPEAPFQPPRFAKDEDAQRITRCFDLPVAYAPGGKVDLTRCMVVAPGETRPTPLRGKTLERLVRLAGVVVSVHAAARHGGAAPRPVEDLWVDVVSGWLPRGLQGDEQPPDWDDVGQHLDDKNWGDPVWAPAAASLTPLLSRWSTRLPILPAAYRRAGVDRLDVLYRRLADLVSLTPEFRRAKIDPHRVLGAVNAIVGADADAVRLGPLLALGASREPRSLVARLTGKQGMLRSALLGTSTFDSGRGVIVPDPGRPIDTVGLPERLCAVLFSDADPDDETAALVYVIRQPTLRPANIVCLTAEPIVGHAIRIHPDLCEALAGDFDGDTVAVHRPRTAAARVEALRLFGPASALRNPAAGGLMAKSDLDLALGHQLLAGDPPEKPAPLVTLLADLPDDRALTALAAVQHERWEAATGWSMGFVDLPTLPELTGAELAARLAAAVAPDPLADLATLHRAGAAGKASGLAQLLVARGVHHGFNPLLDDQDLSDCFLDGFTDEHYFLGARASAARLAEKKLLTPHAGGFTKLLAEIAYEVAVGQDDCGSDAVRRGPLTCRDAMPCGACVGVLPNGRPARAGQRVGLLAAMLVGERSTQLAMKTFHGGGTDAVDLTTLRAVFGQGPTALYGGLTLADHLESLAGAGPTPPAPVLGAALGDVADAVVQAFSDAVARVWVEVLLKQLVEVWRSGRGGSLVQRAKTFGRDPLVTATIHGTVPQGTVPAELMQRHRLGLLKGRW